MSKYVPDNASPLLWRLVGGAVIYAADNEMVVEAPFTDEDTIYMLTAANLHPRLCEALEAFLEIDDEVWRSEFFRDAADAARALLREAEEAAK